MVDSVGFNNKSWLHPAMEPHTEEVHLMERFRRIEAPGGTFIEVQGTVEDRHALTSAYSYNRYYKRQPDMPEDVCNEDPETWKQFRNEALKRQIDRAKQVK